MIHSFALSEVRVVTRFFVVSNFVMILVIYAFLFGFCFVQFIIRAQMLRSIT